MLIAGSWSYHQRNINANFKDTLATVQLISRAPLSRLHNTFHRLPGFDRWLLLAQANHQLWVDARFKDPFFAQLDQYQITQPGQHPLQASQGNVHLSTSVFIRRLREAGYSAQGILFGSRHMVRRHQLMGELDAKNLPNSTVDGQFIMSGLLAAALGLHTFGCLQGQMMLHPMLEPGSGNYGTVNIKTTHRDRHFKIKVYARLVHVIKSFNNRL
jgi:hypothetical protein